MYMVQKLLFLTDVGSHKVKLEEHLCFMGYCKCTWKGGFGGGYINCTIAVEMKGSMRLCYMN